MCLGSGCKSCIQPSAASRACGSSSRIPSTRTWASPNLFPSAPFEGSTCQIFANAIRLPNFEMRVYWAFLPFGPGWNGAVVSFGIIADDLSAAQKGRCLSLRSRSCAAPTAGRAPAVDDEVVALWLAAIASRIASSSSASLSPCTQRRRKSAASSWPRHMYSVPVQVSRTRLQLSQKLWVIGVMKPIRRPVSAT